MELQVPALGIPCGVSRPRVPPTFEPVVDVGRPHNLLRRLAAAPLAEAASLPVAPEDRREAGALLHRFLGYHLPGYRLPAALDLLRARKDRSG